MVDQQLLTITRRRFFALGAMGGLALVAAACSDATSGPSVSSADRPTSTNPPPPATTAPTSTSPPVSSAPDAPTSSNPPPPAATGGAFPLRVDPSHRYLIDANGRPFFMVGDSVWSLITQLPREKVVEYLDDRAGRGFNTLVIDLLSHLFATNAPANFYGDAPFTTPGDYTTPNDAYFAHAKWVIQQAAQRGFLVVLTSSYLGANGGDQGWYVEMKANGPDKLREYGRFIGTYFRDDDNILWVHGGDYNPSELWLVDSVAEGVHETDPDAFETVQNSPESSTLDIFPDRPWVDLNTLYTYGEVHHLAVEEYGRGEMPTFLMESTYEHEYKSSKSLIRAQAYGALLGGTTGQVFGNNPLWHLDGPGIFKVDETWEQALDEQGSRSMTHLASLVRSLDWWTLDPLRGDRLFGSDGIPYEAFAATTKGLAVAYMPTASACMLDLSWLGSKTAALSWFDPANGTIVTIEGSPFDTSVLLAMKPPGPNGDGSADWVLVVKSV